MATCECGTPIRIRKGQKQQYDECMYCRLGMQNPKTPKAKAPECACGQGIRPLKDGTYPTMCFRCRPPARSKNTWEYVASLPPRLEKKTSENVFRAMYRAAR